MLKNHFEVALLTHREILLNMKDNLEESKRSLFGNLCNRGRCSHGEIGLVEVAEQ